MNSSSISRFLPIALLVFVFGCAKAPVEMVDQASQSLQNAQDVQADAYVPELYLAAADSFAAAQAEIELQNAKSAFSRNYDRAEALLTFTVQTADSAVASTDEAKEAMIASNEVLFQQAEAAVTEAMALMGKAPKGKDGLIALASIREDLTLTSNSVAEARAAQAEGNILEARDMAQSALNRANELMGELNSAIESARGGRRS